MPAVRKRMYVIGVVLGLIIVAGIYEFIQYHQAQQQQAAIQQIVEQMNQQGLKVSQGKDGVIVVQP